METAEEKKKLVRERYEKIALENKESAASCCGPTASPDEVYNIMTDDYSQLQGYNPDADLGLGCGLPTQFARIAPGDTVIDLGSGAGNDCFIAHHETGESGKVIGIDFAKTMIQKARTNAEKLGFNNVEFREGDIDDMPVNNAIADVVVSNCVLNLVPNKTKVIGEIFRVLKPGGHFSISDVVLVGQLPEALRHEAEMYVGCVAGAIQKEDYLKYIQKTGFEQVTIQKEKPIVIPNNILSKYLTPEEITDFQQGASGIFSITVFAQKPGVKSQLPKIELATVPNNADGCKPESGCC